jgi:hypothetical protein
MRRLPLVVALLSSCGQSSTLTIEVLHPTTFPENAEGDLRVSILTTDGKPVSETTVPLKNLSRYHLADGLSLTHGKPYVLRLTARDLKGSRCATGRAVGQTTFTYQGSGAQVVYVDCADVSSATGDMLYFRMLHTATYLPAQPQVVIIGGAKIDNLAALYTATATSTLETYSLADGTFHKLNSTLEAGRVWHQAVAGDDQVVSLGGLKRNDTPPPPLTAFAEVARLVHPAPSGEVEVRGADGTLRARRGLHAVVPLEGRVLVVGGAQSYTIAGPADLVPGAELYDLGKNVSTPIAGAATRVSPAAAPFGPRRALVAGGWSEPSSPKQTEIFCGEGAPGCTCKPPCFMGGASLPGERLYLTATYVPCTTGESGAVYLVGGLERQTGKDVQHAEIYCVPTSDPTKLVPYGNLVVGRSNHTTTLVRGTQGPRLFVAGGSNLVGLTGGALDKAELVPVACDCTLKSGVAQVALRVKRSGHTATLLPDGTVLLAGGFAEKSAERFNPDL